MRDAFSEIRTVFLILAVFFLTLVVPQNANAQAKISCMQWCQKCSPGSAACRQNCVERHQPEVNPSCTVRYHGNRTLDFSIKNGESIDLFAVYWVSNCKSVLRNLAGIDVMQGSPGVTLSLREGLVHARRQGCSKPVKGATVVATAKSIRAPAEAKLVFRVRYNTLDGTRQSTHTINLNLFP